MHHTSQKELYLNIIAVIMTLAVVHIFGRFVFTPLMPYFIEEQLFTLEQATDLASINYLGYLIGALLAIFCSTPQRVKKILLIALFLNILMTVLQCFFATFSAVFTLRLLNGVGNGVVFVLAPALMLEWLHTQQKAHLSGYMYFGISIGLLVSGFLVTWTAPYFQQIERWIPIAILSVIFGALGFYQLAKLQVQLPERTSQHDIPPLFDKRSTLLFLAYLGAGLGYILPMTFTRD